MTESLVYIDGDFVPESEAKISVLDHGFLYGDGVFEGIRAYKGVVFKLKEHVERLYDSAKFLKIEIPMSKEELIEAILETVRKNGLKDCYIRVVVTRGVGDLGLDPRKCGKPSVIIIAKPMGPLLGKKAVSLIISSVRRDGVDATNHQAKSLNYLNSILAKLEAINAGADDAVMLDNRGFVSEATGENIFIVKNGKILTPPPTSGVLLGITRNCIIELAKKLGYEVVERELTPFELITADEVFLTGTAAEIVPVESVNGRKIGTRVPGPITERLIKEFEKLKGDPSQGIKI
ncbi:MAG: branched-chain amino acid aminotransferase [Thaumarchaeota archaeon]|nr:MAG: branched-chain amino acid aminotransferase [Nitrososphaerota archaeon]